MAASILHARRHLDGLASASRTTGHRVSNSGRPRRPPHCHAPTTPTTAQPDPEGPSTESCFTRTRAEGTQKKATSRARRRRGARDVLHAAFAAALDRCARLRTLSTRHHARRSMARAPSPRRGLGTRQMARVTPEVDASGRRSLHNLLAAAIQESPSSGHNVRGRRSHDKHRCPITTIQHCRQAEEGRAVDDAWRGADREHDPCWSERDRQQRGTTGTPISQARPAPGGQHGTVPVLEAISVRTMVVRGERGQPPQRRTPRRLAAESPTQRPVSNSIFPREPSEEPQRATIDPMSILPRSAFRSPTAEEKADCAATPHRPPAAPMLSFEPTRSRGRDPERERETRRWRSPLPRGHGGSARRSVSVTAESAGPPASDQPCTAAR